MKKYFYSDGLAKFGPFTFEELKNENIKKETLIWFEGLENWKSAESINEFKEIFELLPPPISVPDIDKHSTQGDENDYVPTKKIITAQTKPDMFLNSFSFEGRIRRLEYGISVIIYFISSLLVN